MDVHTLALAASESYTVATLYNTDTGAQVLIKETPDTRIVAFAGTQLSDGDDIKADINIIPIWPAPLGVMVHKGFYDALESLVGDIIALIYPYPDKALYLTGHSLGGAMATICAGYFAKCGVRINGLVTFGAPKAGGSGLANITSSVPGYRFVRDGDTIAKLPLGWLIWYRHDREAYALPGDPDIFGDHAMQGYADAVKHRGLKA